MITNQTITKLAKAYPKRTIANKGPKVGNETWSNGFILFWETPPDFVANHHDKREVPSLDDIEIPQDMPALYPVEIRFGESFNYPFVKMTNGNGHTHWLNGKYLSAAIKQAKRQAKNVSFAFCEPQGEEEGVTGILATLLDRPLAIIATLDEDQLGLKNAPYWQLMNNDLPMPVYAGRPEYINPDLITQFYLL